MTQIKAGVGLTLTVRGDWRLDGKRARSNGGCAVRPATHKLAAGALAVDQSTEGGIQMKYFVRNSLQATNIFE